MSSDPNSVQPPIPITPSATNGAERGTVQGTHGPGTSGGMPLTTTPGGAPPTTAPEGTSPSTTHGGAPPAPTQEGTSSSAAPGGASSSTMPGGAHPSAAPGGTPPSATPEGAPPSLERPRKKVSRPRTPSPPPPVTGKHGTHRRENFLNKKAAKSKAGESVPLLRLKDTPRKKRWFEQMLERQGQESTQGAEGSGLRQPEPPKTPRSNKTREQDLIWHQNAPQPPQTSAHGRPPAIPPVYANRGQPPHPQHPPHAQPPAIPPPYTNQGQQPVYPSHPHGYPQQQTLYPAYVQQQPLYGNYMPMAQPLPLVMPPPPQLPPNPYPYVAPPQPPQGQMDPMAGWNASHGAGPYQQDRFAIPQTPRHGKTHAYQSPRRPASVKKVRYRMGDDFEMDWDEEDEEDGGDEYSEDERPRRGRWELDDSDDWRPRDFDADEDVFNLNNDYEMPEEEVVDEHEHDEDEREDEAEEVTGDVEEGQEAEEQEAEEQLMEDVEEDADHRRAGLEGEVEGEAPPRDPEGPRDDDLETNSGHPDHRAATVNLTILHKNRTSRETFHRHSQASTSRNGGEPSNRASTRKGKERARTPLSTSHARHPIPRSSQEPQTMPPAPPMGGDGYIAFLFERMREMNELQREQNEYNRQWQMDMLTTVKKLDRRVSRGQVSSTSAQHGRARGGRVRADRIRPSNSMASRIVLEPQDRALTPKELQSLEQKEKAHLADLQNVVRVHLKKLLRVKSWKEMAEKYPPLDEDEIWVYESSGPGDFFDEDTFRVDFVEPWKEFPFNLSARDFFVRHLHDVLSGGSYKKAAIPARYITHDHIGDALDVHMDHARKRYREAVQPPSPGQVEHAKRKSRMTSRRGTLYNARYRTTQQVTKFNRFEDLFALMSGTNMSADETDRDEAGARQRPTKYTITRASWMSAALRKVCCELDKENVENREVQIGNVGTRGNGPRTRADATPPQEADTRAPEGLWRDCYSIVWLAGLKDDQVRRLNIIDEDFGLSIAPIDLQSESEEE